MTIATDVAARPGEGGRTVSGFAGLAIVAVVIAATEGADAIAAILSNTAIQLCFTFRLRRVAADLDWRAEQRAISLRTANVRRNRAAIVSAYLGDTGRTANV